MANVDDARNGFYSRRSASALGTKLSITAIILTFNEEIHIERCIASVASLVQRIVVVDSFSSDRTVEIAKRFGAEVTQRAFKHQADQFQWRWTIANSPQTGF